MLNGGNNPVPPSNFHRGRVRLAIGNTHICFFHILQLCLLALLFFQLKTACANPPSRLSHQRHLDAAPRLMERQLKNATKWQLQPILPQNLFSSAFAFASHQLSAFNLQLENSVFTGRALAILQTRLTLTFGSN